MKQTKTNKKSAVLSEDAVQFFKKHIVNDMCIINSIDNIMLCKIEDKLYEYEDDNINEDGTEKSTDYLFFERNKKASEILAELYSIWNDGDVDFDDLNRRLGLI